MATKTKRRNLVDETAADNAMLLAAICAGLARWEQWEHSLSGEVCIDGLCYTTSRNELGCPTVGPTIRHALVKVLARK